VKDKYGKTINYMEAVFATNCCIGFDSKPKTYVCHDKLFVRNLVEGIVKSFLSGISSNLWYSITKKDDDDVVEQKVYHFLKPNQVLHSVLELFILFSY